VSRLLNAAHHPEVVFTLRVHGCPCNFSRFDLGESTSLADLATDWCAMIVGFHFLPLAGIFRAPNLRAIGILMMLWCAISWVLFRSESIAISASLGTGILLWATCVAALFRAQRIAYSLCT
jgi:hypothetical protein